MASQRSGAQESEARRTAEIVRIRPAEVPPAGVFPATITYHGEVRGIVTVEITVEWGRNATYAVSRQFDPCSKSGKRILTALRKAAALGPAQDGSELQGREISVRGEQQLKGGRTRWRIASYLPKVEASTDRNTIVSVAPDEHDSLADLFLKGLGDARFVERDDRILILQKGCAPVPIDENDTEYAALQHKITGLGTVEYKGRIVAQRVLFKAKQQVQWLRFALFSHATDSRIMVPIQGGAVLRITASGFDEVENGTDGVWLEHPRQSPFPWNVGSNPQEGMKEIERLLVDTIPHPRAEWRYLFIGATVFGPFARHLAPSRPIIEITGPSGHGKTSAARRPIRFLGLGDVQGDYSVAQLERDGDIGLVVRDNVEAGDLNRLLQNFIIYAATGAEWARVGAGRNDAKPVIAVTTVEGIGSRSETERRLLRFELQLTQPPIDEAPILVEIERKREVMVRAVAELLRTFLSLGDSLTPPVIPMPDFQGYCKIIYRILRAWQHVAGHGADFADKIFDSWLVHRRGGTTDDAVGPYPRLLEKLVTMWKAQKAGEPLRESFKQITSYSHASHSGNLYVGTPTSWVTWMKDAARNERDLTPPDEPAGLHNRLSKLKPSHGYILLTDSDDPITLKRTALRRVWGVFEILA